MKKNAFIFCKMVAYIASECSSVNAATHVQYMGGDLE